MSMMRAVGSFFKNSPKRQEELKASLLVLKADEKVGEQIEDDEQVMREQG